MFPGPKIGGGGYLTLPHSAPAGPGWGGGELCICHIYIYLLLLQWCLFGCLGNFLLLFLYYKVDSSYSKKKVHSCYRKNKTVLGLYNQKVIFPYFFWYLGFFQKKKESVCGL